MLIYSVRVYSVHIILTLPPLHMFYECTYNSWHSIHNETQCLKIKVLPGCLSLGNDMRTMAVYVRPFSHKLLTRRLETWSASPEYLSLVPWGWWVFFSLLGGESNTHTHTTTYPVTYVPIFSLICV